MLYVYSKKITRLKQYKNLEFRIGLYLKNIVSCLFQEYFV